MTAKQMKQQAECEKLIIFTRGKFEEFCTQLCKEQRQLCLDYLSIDGEIDDDIINAPGPEL